VTEDATDDSSETLAAIVEEISDRVRSGDKPALPEYASRYPQFATRLATLLPALTALETTHDTPRLPSGVPDQLGDYRLLRAVGRGGMGTVYEATQISLGRTVAVKVLNEHAPPVILERFRRESRAAGKLQHPNIVPVYGVGDAEGRSFYVMRYVRGIGLNALLDRLRGGNDSTPLWIRREGHFRSVVRFVAEIAEALAHAHERGILHRDVKPANILIDGDRRAWITDFGLAKEVGADDLTQPKEIVGTIRYMAPERFSGVGGVQADIYALGAVLYEALTLRAAYEQDDRRELMYAVCHSKPPKPRTRNRAIPKDLETIVLKAMALNPADRYAAADDLAIDLRCVLADRGISARRPTLPEEVARWCRRYPAACGLTLGLLLVACGSALFLFLQNRKLNDALDTSRNNERQASVRQLDLLISEASAIAQSGRMGRSFESLRRLDEARTLAAALGLSADKRLDLRNGVVAATVLPDLAAQPAPDLGTDSGQGFFAHVRADLFARREGAVVRVHRLSTGELLRTLPIAGTHASSQCEWSPRGDALVVGAPGFPAAEVFDLTSSRSTPILAFTAPAHYAPRPIGDELLAVDDAGLTLWNLKTAAKIKTIPLTTVRKGTHWRAAWHPTKPLAFLSHYYDMRTLMIDTETGAIRDDRTTTDRVAGAAWHPNGRTLLLAGHSDTTSIRFLKTYDHTDSLTLSRVRDAQDVFVQLKFDATGDRILATGWAAFVALYDDRCAPLFASASYRDGIVVGWSADGRLGGVCSDGARFHRLRVGKGRLFRPLVDPHDYAEPIGGKRLLPDGRRLVFQCGEELHVVEASSGRPLLRRPIGDGLFVGTTPAGDILVGNRDGSRETVRIEETAGPAGPTLRAVTVERTTSEFTTAATPDGRTTATFSRQAETVVIRTRAEGKTEWRTVELATGRNQTYLSLAPDGRWAVTAARLGEQGRLWDLRTGLEVPQASLTAGGGVPLFSPDGRKLWISARGGRFLDVGTWAEGPVVGRSVGMPAYTPDGKFLAIEDGSGRIRIASVETSQTIVLLSHPQQVVSNDLEFSPDGNWLLIRNGTTPSGIFVWEISAIRKSLRDNDLDWD